MTDALIAEPPEPAQLPAPAPAEAAAPERPPTRPPTAIDRAITDYLQHMGVERGLAANTLSAYRRDLARYARHLAHAGRERPAEITRHDVTGFVQALSDGSDGGSALGIRSAARTVVAVRGLHKFWALEGVTPTDPASDVHPPMPGKRLPKAISVDEVTRILEAAGTDTATGLRDRALLEFLYSTGARISEAVGLDVDDISLHTPEQAGEVDGPAIVRLFGKGSKERLVPLGSYGARALDAYLVRGRPLLAAKGKGTPALVPQRPRRQDQPAKRLDHFEGCRGQGQHHQRRFTAHPAALLRHPPARRRCRRPGGPGTAGTRLGDHHAGLHPGDGRYAAGDLRRRAPEGAGLKRPE